MKLEVYPTDAEAFEAAAALAAERLRQAAAVRRPSVALPGGRSGRGVMIALAARDDVPWDRIEWFWGDERCVGAEHPLSNVRLARETLLGPRRAAEGCVHPPAGEPGDAEEMAAAYAEILATYLGRRPAPVFDLVLLGVGANGHVASLMPGSRALHAGAPVAAVPRAEVSAEPRVARITITPPMLRAARSVLVTVTGEAKAAAVAAAMRDPLDPDRLPAQLVRPSDTVAWIVDRAAAGELLRDARRVDAQ